MLAWHTTYKAARSRIIILPNCILDSRLIISMIISMVTVELHDFIRCARLCLW